MRFLHASTPENGVSPLIAGLDRVLRQRGHGPAKAEDEADLVIHPVKPDAPKPFRRRGRGTFVLSVASKTDTNASLDNLYPLLVRTLSNLLIVVTGDDPIVVH